MKKLLAMLLALMMALSCTLAMAEEASGVTLISKPTVDRDAIMELLPMFGVEGEEQTKMVDILLALINASEEQLVICSEGLQYDLNLNGASALSAVIGVKEDGVTVGSSLFPNYQLSVSLETILNAAKASAEQKAESLKGLDIPAMTESLTGYFTEYINACISSVSMGEPEVGDYQIEGCTFNTKTPIIVDIPAINEAVKTLFQQINDDEAISAALQTAGVTLPSADEIDATEGIGDVNGEVYTYIDEEGNQSDEAYVIVNVIPSGSETPGTTVNVLAQGSNVKVTVSVPDAQSEVVVTVNPSENGGFAARVDINATGVYVGFDFTVDLDAGVITANLYFSDPENAIASDVTTITAGGQLTASVDSEGKTVLAVEDLMSAEDPSEMTSGLLMDVLMNGLGGLMSAITEAVPEASSLMDMLGSFMAA